MLVENHDKINAMKKQAEQPCMNSHIATGQTKPKKDCPKLQARPRMFQDIRKFQVRATFAR
jgi:hypothetical protein